MRSELSRERQKEYIKKYKKEHYKNITIKLKLDEDKDILDYIQANTGNTSEIMRKLLKELIAKK